MKIAVGLSGGVDSAVAAYLLKKKGHEVIGITMKIWDETLKGTFKGNACFGPDEKEDLEDIKHITEILKISMHVLDLSEEYSRDILDYFRKEYASGRTPNPCVRCNQSMKFKLLLKKARESGIDFDYFATGHYAKVKKNKKSGRIILKKARDSSKDQSYFLSLLTQEQLSNVIFPLGRLKKKKVKKIARRIGLRVYDKKESQDFYPGDYNDLLDRLPEKGDIVLANGKVLGRHKGIFHYTIGQRKGLGISYNEPLYVIEIDKEENRIIVGLEKNLYRKELIVANPNWIIESNFKNFLKVKAKIRYLHKEAPAIIEKTDVNKIRLLFNKPQRAIAPGQYAVFYKNKMVVGAGVIEKVVS